GRDCFGGIHGSRFCAKRLGCQISLRRLYGVRASPMLRRWCLCGGQGSVLACDCSRYFLVHSPIQSRTVWYQSKLFCGFRIQWPSSGKSTSFDGTFSCCSTVKSCRLWPVTSRKSCSPCVTSVGVLKSLA